MPTAPQTPLTWTRSNVPSYAAQCRALWQGVVSDTGDPRLIDFAVRLLDELELGGRQEAELAEGVQRWVARNIRFYRERPERFASALRTLQWRIGDCDDQVRLLGAILRGFRIPYRLRFLRMRDPRTGKKVSHVYGLAKLRGVWVPLETVRPVPPGFDPAAAFRQQGFVIDDVETVGDP